MNRYKSGSYIVNYVYRGIMFSYTLVELQTRASVHIEFCIFCCSTSRLIEQETVVLIVIVYIYLIIPGGQVLKPRLHLPYD